MIRRILSSLLYSRTARHWHASAGALVLHRVTHKGKGHGQPFEASR